MVAYGLGITPLTQLWYGDESGAGGTFGGIRQHLDNLMVRGPPQGYFPYLTNSILGMSPRNVLQAEAFFIV